MDPPPGSVEPQGALTIHPIPPADPPGGMASVKRIVPWLVAVAFFMESLDTTILNTAVPTVAAALGIAPLDMKSVLSSYTLSVAVFIPLSGWVADRFGTRRVFSTAIGIFTLGSVLCGVASSVHLLTMCRVVQGVGGAMMVPVGRLTMIRAFPKSQLVRGMAFVAIPALIGPMLGPLAGGLIVRFLHWRLIFFLNLPFGLVGLYLVYRHLPDYRALGAGGGAQTDDGGGDYGDNGAGVPKLDYVGLVLFGCGIALLSYVLEVFGEHRLAGSQVVGLLIVSILLLAAYGRHARTVPHPLLHLGLLRIRTLRTAVLGSFVTRLGVGGMPFLLPLLYQVGLGYSALQSGLLILPQSLAAMSLRMTMPGLLRRFGYRRVLLSNTAMIGILIGLFALVGPRTPVWVIGMQAFAFGFFASFQYTSMNTVAYADVSESQASMASTIVSTTQQMSMSFGIAAASLVTAFFLPLHVAAKPSNPPPEVIISGIHKAFVALGVVTLLSTLLFRQLKRDDGANVSQQKVALPAV